MRIIAGQRRGHKIDGPRGTTSMRPTSDLVRESIFNIVGGMMPGRMAVDLFAGTRAVGLEALSRGATRALFIEKNREHVGLIHRNIAILRYQDRAQVRLADAYRWARAFQPEGYGPMAVFLDPPYRHYEIRRRQLSQLMRTLTEKLPRDSVICIEAGRELDAEILQDIASWDIRRYGDTQIAIRVRGVADSETCWEARQDVHHEPAAVQDAQEVEKEGVADVETQARRDFALEVVVRLRQAGFQALWAGGCVRDLLLGLVPADYDVATSATPEQVMLSLPFRAITVGVSFGVVRIRHHRMPGIEVEVATFRSDSAYVDGRRPQAVVYSSPELDAARRDFTINGMFMDPETSQVIDYVGGREDLHNQVLRAIGDPPERFREDKLRLLRAVRFAARFSLTIEPKTWRSLKAMAPEVVAVSPERIAQEVRRMLVHKNRAQAMNLALDAGLIAAILPPLIAMRGLFQGKPVQPEGDLWDHTMLVLELLPSRPSFALAFAALVHDVGKPFTRANHHGRPSFHSHDQVGSRIADQLCTSLRLSNAERERITWLVAYHQYLGDAKKLRESKLKRVLAQPEIDELLALHRADALASTGDTEQVDYCSYYLKNQPAGPINPPPLLTGHDLVRHGLEPGPHFAVILETIREAQLDRKVQNKREALEWVDYYQANRSWPEGPSG